MSDERFDRIEMRLEQAAQENSNQFARVDERFARMDERFDRIDDRFDRIDERFARIDERFERIDDRFDRVEGRVEHLHQRVGVLHEDVLSRIAATGESEHATKHEMERGFADLRELIERRIDPLDAAIRDHSIRIAALEKRLG